MPSHSPNLNPSPSPSPNPIPIPSPNQVHVSLESACGLPSPDGQTGEANAYVVAMLGDDRGQDQRTAVKANSRSPRWGESFDWTGFKGELTSGSLRLEVRNKDGA